MKEKDNLEDKIKRQSRDYRLLTVKEVAELLRISRFSVYNLVKRGDLSVVKVLNKFRFDMNSVEKYLEKQRINIEEK
ncbi:MAG: helix-turn-helix domain-containing protein [Deltaproteobacteria bacterium]|jgi:excisionase family DNA binding protein|nr:helix-turn-helix domain-containing protein [Deltaproteobacteria bacterium]MBW2183502.1 helix-turn-helix domain-containing protein [Deltaproteobacteria bacterium]